MSEGQQGQGEGRSPEAPSGGGFSIFKPLRIPQYRRYMLAFFGAGFAFQSSQVVLGWQTFDLTNDVRTLGSVLFVFGISIVIGSLVGGVAADRYDRRTIIVSSQIFNTIIVIALAFAVVFDMVALWQMYALAGVSGAAQAGHLPARQAFVFNIVGRKDLPSALALSTSVMNLMRLASPAIAGVVIAEVGVEAAWFAVAGGMMVSIFVMLFVIGPTTQKYAADSHSPLRAMAEGFRYLVGNRTLFLLASIMLGTAIIGLPYRDLMPAFASDALDLGPRGFGFIMSMVGAGGLLGSITIAFVVGSGRRTGPVILAFGTAWGLTLAAVSFAPNVGVAIPLLIMLGWANTGFQNFMNITIQTNVDDAYRGRIMSFSLVTFGLHPIGTLWMGFLANSLGIRTAFFIAGVVLAIFVVAIGTWRRDLRRLT
jgi:MFS family permease